MAKKKAKPARRAAPARSPNAARRARSLLSPPTNYRQVLGARELFWNNVIREMLTSLSVMRHATPAALPPGHDPQAPQPGTADNPPPPPPSNRQLFDGRLAVITTTGARIPIAEVFPLLACGVPTSDTERELAIAVECTVFQILTPGGEMFTLPLHEIRGFHALTEDVMDRLEEETRRQAGPEAAELDEPFGFAAFTSLARTKSAPPPPDDAI